MAKGYELLEKKVEELATQLKDLFCHPPVETPYLQLPSEVINGRFVFLKNLLSAEIQSQPDDLEHFHQIAQSLEELESFFKYWDSCRISSINNLDTASKRSYSAESLLNDDKVLLEGGDGGSPDVDTASTCSFPESCLNNDEVSSGGGGDTHLHKDVLFEGVVQEQKAMETVMAEGCGKEEREKGRLWLSGNKVCAVMSGVMIVIVAIVGVVMGSFYGYCCYGSGLEDSLPPT